MVFFITKLRIRHIALKDAQGQYGSYLILSQLPSGHEAAVFKPSDWMISRAVNYKNTVEKLNNSQKKIYELNSQIRQYYAKFMDVRMDLKKKEREIFLVISALDKDISQIMEDIKAMEKWIGDFQKGEPLQNGMTPRQLMRSKNELDQTYANKLAQKRSMSDRSSLQAEYDRLLNDFREKVIQLESDLSLQIDLLYKKIRKTEIRYNEQISYYWSILRKGIHKNRLLKNKKETIAITEHIKALADFAESCGVEVKSQEDLFKSERNHINNDINSKMDIQFKV